MLIELSSSPKPGNVDRCHDFGDIGFHHFLISAVSAYPVFRAAASGRGRVGSLILKGVKAWSDWNISSNTHFGSLILMVPLAMAAGRPGSLRDELAAVLKNTSVKDAVDFYQAFYMAGARVADVEDFSLKDPDSAKRLYRENRTLLDLMRLSQGHDLIAREWSTSYERSFNLAARLEKRISASGQGLNEGVVRTFLEALAEVPDSLIQAKFGESKAREVSTKAALALNDETLDSARRLDLELLAGDINPGSTADLIAASLFISLLKGLRF
jgi:triphosphoribosyl-dephospho-CoA synthase